MPQVMLGEFGHWLLLLCVSLLVVAQVKTVCLGSEDKTIIPSDILFVASLLPMLLALLIFCFLRDDFSLRYVWENSHTGLALDYKILALWGGHEGSWLLWCAISCVYAAIATQTCTALRSEHTRVVRVTLLALLLYGVFLSNPFARMLPFAPGEGKDLNPLLQDGAMSIHPPCLYLGYCAFLVPFALSCVLPDAQYPARVCQQIHRWALWGWGWLTMGICLGSWWAYRELGWGGWWFWDPVENAALIPWLVASALLHVSRGKQDASYTWTIFLSQACFMLTFVGTWITRSGVLLSVHGFAQAPGRSLGLLGIATVVTIMGIHTWTHRKNKHASEPSLSWTKLAAAVLLSMALVVLAGTLYPLCAKWWLGSLRVVGGDYFNKALAPFWLLLFMGMGLQAEAKYAYRKLLLHVVLTGLTGLVFGHLFFVHLQLNYNILLAVVALYALIAQVHLLFLSSPYHWFQNTVHIVVLLLAICISVNIGFSTEETFILTEKEANIQHESHAFSVTALPVVADADKKIKAFRVIVSHQGQNVELRPRIVFYETRSLSQSKSDQISSWWQDINVTISQMDADHVIVRVQMKPLQKLFWVLGLMLGLLGVIASVWPRLRRVSLQHAPLLLFK